MTNSRSRLRSGFSPSVVRKSVKRERMLPARCFTMMATLLDSGLGLGKKLLVAELRHGVVGQALVAAQATERFVNIEGGKIAHGLIVS